MFCGRSTRDGAQMSREHVLRKKFQPVMDSGPASHFVSSRDARTGETRLDKKSGSIWSVKVRKVCTDCNNGWMNRDVEQPIEDELLSMMTGGPASLTQDKTAGLALWAAKTAIVMSGVKHSEDALPLALRRTLMETLSPPTVGCMVLVGRVEGDGVTSYGGNYGEQRLVPTNEQAYRVQQTKMILGSLMVFVSFVIRAHPAASEKYTFGLSGGTLERTKTIWPNPTPLSWPEDFPEPLTGDEVMTLGDGPVQPSSVLPSAAPTGRPLVFARWPPSVNDGTRPTFWTIEL